MVDYICPECRGGFPVTAGEECPWCGQPFDGTYEPVEPTHAISQVKQTDEQETLAGPIYQRLVGWLE